MIRSLSEAEIARVLTYEQLIPAMERALAAFSAGEVLQPVRTMLTIEEGQRFLGVMPAVTQNAMGAKLVCFYPKNAAAGLPTHLASIVLFEPDTGAPSPFSTAASSRRCAPRRSRRRSRAIWRRQTPGCWR